MVHRGLGVRLVIFHWSVGRADIVVYLMIITRCNMMDFMSDSWFYVMHFMSNDWFYVFDVSDLGSHWLMHSMEVTTSIT